MYWSAKEVALVPVGPATCTSTVPAEPAGAVAVMSLSVLTVKAAATPPNVTLEAPVNPAPVTSTELPPDVGPADGKTLSTLGWKLKPKTPSKPVPFAVAGVMPTN